MSKKILIDAFFNQFTEFLKELVSMYPDDQDFKVYSDTVSLIRSTNPMLVINFIKTEIVDHHLEQIKNKDEAFFMNYDYETRKDVDLDIVNKLKRYIDGMTPNSKDMVWKYIDIITKLCIKILDL